MLRVSLNLIEHMNYFSYESHSDRILLRIWDAMDFIFPDTRFIIRSSASDLVSFWLYFLCSLFIGEHFSVIIHTEESTVSLYSTLLHIYCKFLSKVWTWSNPITSTVMELVIFLRQKPHWRLPGHHDEWGSWAYQLHHVPHTLWWSSPGQCWLHDLFLRNVLFCGSYSNLYCV